MSIESRLRARFGDLELDVAGSEAYCERAAHAFFPLFARQKVGPLPKPPPALPPPEQKEPPGDFLAELAALGVRDEDEPEPVETPAEPDDGMTERERALTKWYVKMNVPSDFRTRKRNHCILFIYYLTVVEGAEYATQKDILWAFDVVGGEPPKAFSASMSGWRKTPWILAPQKVKGKQVRGKYALSKTGLRFVEGWVRV